MPATRTPGKYGRRSPDLTRPSIRLGDVLTGELPSVPPDSDYLAALDGGWEILGNDQYGDCNAVAWANSRRVVTTTLTPSAPRYPGLDQVLAFYRTQNPDFDPDGSADANGPGSSADGGMSIQAGLEHLSKHGGPDGVRAVAFAKVDPHDAAEVRAAIALFGYLWTGINVTQANEDEFSSGQPWDYDPNSSVIGGHAVIAGGYGQVPADAEKALRGDEKFITWGAESSFTDPFWAQQAEECWVVLWPEHLGSAAFLAGIDLAALRGAYEALTGKELPVQPPQPGPAPDPGPVSPHAPGGSLAAEAAAIFRRVEASAGHDIARFVRFCRDHGF